LTYQIDDQLDNAETMVNIQIKNLVEEAGARTNGRASTTREAWEDKE
jgi:hypothetical protein